MNHTVWYIQKTTHLHSNMVSVLFDIISFRFSSFCSNAAAWNHVLVNCIRQVFLNWPSRMHWTFTLCGFAQRPFCLHLCFPPLIDFLSEISNACLFHYESLFEETFTLKLMDWPTTSLKYSLHWSSHLPPLYTLFFIVFFSVQTHDIAFSGKINSSVSHKSSSVFPSSFLLSFVKFEKSAVHENIVFNFSYFSKFSWLSLACKE